MDLYGQEPEARLLNAFLFRLDCRSVIDVGAEHGAFAEQMLGAGADEIHVIDPEPANAVFLRERFRDEARVTVHELAVSDTDGELELHKSVDPSGEPVTFGHTVLVRPDTPEIAWRETVRVRARSLASLVDAGDLPRRVGILKVDTEGHDLAVIAGMGDLECDVVMVEHWTDLPLSLGPCPWSTAEMVSALRERGFSHFAFIVHRGDFVILKWDDGSVPSGHMGNLVFLHDRIVERLLPDVVECASSLAERSVESGEMYAVAAGERRAVIEELTRERELLAETAAERLAVIEGLTAERDLQANEASERATVIEELRRELDLQMATGHERLATIEKLGEARDLEARTIDELRAAVEELRREHDLQARAADERLATIEELERERDLQAKAAEERLATIEELERERDLQASVAGERLATIEDLERERDLQAQAANERQSAIEELKRERDLQAEAAEARLAVIEELEREADLRLRALDELSAAQR